MPERPRSHQLEDESNRAFEAHLPSRWVARRMHPDYGLDYTVEIFDTAHKATGLTFHAQLKATDEPNLARALGNVRLRRATADYYRSLTLPVLIVLFHAPSERLFARWFHAYNPHLAKREGQRSDGKTIRFQFHDVDLFDENTPEVIEAGLRGFLKFRSPELELPLRVAVTSDDPSSTTDTYGTAFALRRALLDVSDLVTVEVREPAPDDPCIALGIDRYVVSLADVASVTLDHDKATDATSDSYAADVALALSVALAYVGQANLSAQIASAVGASSQVIADPEVSMTIAGAMYRSRRIREAIQLADALDASQDEDIRSAAFGLLTVLLARGQRLTADEREVALTTAKQRLERRLERGDERGAAAEAYSLAMLEKRLRDAPSAIESFRKAAALDARYLNRGYYHSDFAGVLFEHRDYHEAAEHYGQAVKLGQRGMTLALHADALLFSGRYEAAERKFDEYLADNPGPEGAEWRLKRAVLPLMIETVGSEQNRQPEAAETLLGQWDLENGPDMAVEAAWQACSEAIGLDACAGEAWFRLAILAIAATEDPTEGGPFASAGAVLKRDFPAAWTNAVLCCDPADEQSISDMLHAGYQLCGDGLVQNVTEAVPGAEHFTQSADRVIELLDQAVVRVDHEERTRSFKMRIEGDDGEMQELVFGSGDETDDTTPDAPTSVKWRPVSAKSGAARRKRPGKSHGKNKRRKRRT